MVAHRHKDLIIAWANGAEIQVMVEKDQWVDTNKPEWLPKFNYRIKPEAETTMTQKELRDIFYDVNDSMESGLMRVANAVIARYLEDQ